MLTAEEKHERASIYRCAVADTIKIVDMLIVALSKSSRKSEREIGDSMHRALQPVFDESRALSPATYDEAVRAGMMLEQVLLAGHPAITARQRAGLTR